MRCNHKTSGREYWRNRWESWRWPRQMWRKNSRSHDVSGYCWQLVFLEDIKTNEKYHCCKSNGTSPHSESYQMQRFTIPSTRHNQTKTANQKRSSFPQRRIVTMKYFPTLHANEHTNTHARASYTFFVTTLQRTCIGRSPRDIFSQKKSYESYF